MEKRRRVDLNISDLPYLCGPIVLIGLLVYGCSNLKFAYDDGHFDLGFTVTNVPFISATNGLSPTNSIGK